MAVSEILPPAPEPMAGLEAAAIAHDLGNMLQIAASAIHHVQRNLDAIGRETLCPHVRTATESLARAGALARSLVEQARPAPPARKPVSVPAVLAGIRDLILASAGPNVSVEFIVPDEMPVIGCDPLELEHVILNLVGNARDAMPDGGDLTLSLSKACLFRNAHVVMRVCDTGKGMSAETARHAFTPFFTTKRNGAGSGLGLAAVQAFALRNGGSAHIETELGTGTTVGLTLPAYGIEEFAEPETG